MLLAYSAQTTILALYSPFLQNEDCPEMLDWNDLRYMIAVADRGSTLAAGQALRVSQTTVARRISALETALGADLFYRQQSGYRPTSLCDALIARARGVAGEVDAIHAIADTHRRQLSGTVLVTASELYGVTLLPPLLQALRTAHPDIHVELDLSDGRRDLATGAADIAVRLGAMPTDAGLKIRRVAYDRWAVYCSQSYAREHGVPANIDEMASRAIIGGGGPGVWAIYSEWLRSSGLDNAVTIHFGSATGLLAAVRSGVGLSVLPTLVGENEPDLIRCLSPAADRRPVWIATHERVANRPAVRAVSDFLAERIARLPGA